MKVPKSLINESAILYFWKCRNHEILFRTLVPNSKKSYYFCPSGNFFVQDLVGNTHCISRSMTKCSFFCQECPRGSKVNCLKSHLGTFESSELFIFDTNTELSSELDNFWKTDIRTNGHLIISEKRSRKKMPEDNFWKTFTEKNARRAARVLCLGLDIDNFWKTDIW